MKHRLRCKLFGCVQAEDYFGCHFCQAAIYDDFIEVGKLDWFFRLQGRVTRWFRRFERKKCMQCGKKFWRGYDNELCSEECHEDWLPF